MLKDPNLENHSHSADSEYNYLLKSMPFHSRAAGGSLDGNVFHVSPGSEVF